MFTQTIKQWLNKLFAWWPWRKTSVQNYNSSARFNAGPGPEQIKRTSVDGSEIQPGGTFIAVEHNPAHEAATGAFRSTSSAASDERMPGIPKKLQEENIPAIQQERQLEFLRYLVRQGIVHEDFPADQIPEQYRCQRKQPEH